MGGASLDDLADAVLLPPATRRADMPAAAAAAAAATKPRAPPAPPSPFAPGTPGPPPPPKGAAAARMRAPPPSGERPRHIQVELDLRLLKAAAAGDLERLRTAHANGGDMVAVGANGGLPLHFAAKGGHVDACSFLLSHGAEVDAPTAQQAGGFAPLWVASQYGQADAIAALIEAGAAVDRRAVDGSTALWIAAAKGRDDAVKALLAVRTRRRRGRSTSAPIHPPLAPGVSLRTFDLD